MAAEARQGGGCGGFTGPCSAQFQRRGNTSDAVNTWSGEQSEDLHVFCSKTYACVVFILFRKPIISYGEMVTIFSQTLKDVTTYLHCSHLKQDWCRTCNFLKDIFCWVFQIVLMISFREIKWETSGNAVSGQKKSCSPSRSIPSMLSSSAPENPRFIQPAMPCLFVELLIGERLSEIHCF